MGSSTDDVILKLAAERAKVFAKTADTDDKVSVLLRRALSCSQRFLIGDIDLQSDAAHLEICLKERYQSFSLFLTGKHMAVKLDIEHDRCGAGGMGQLGDGAH